jgi:hypothetical protein
MIIAGHAAILDARGQLKPWTSWRDALAREMRFYRDCPVEHGYPRFVSTTFLDAAWAPTDRIDTIPAMQNGMGILSYLKYQEQNTGSVECLSIARAMGDYLVKEATTPAEGAYPRFTRSTGRRGQFPQPPDAGSQSDRPFEVQPDKAGIAGFALERLFSVCGERAYLEQALHNATVLAAHQRSGDALRSPWPFRVDYRSGEGRGPVSGNMTYILRLYDALLAHGFEEFAAPRQALWRWIEHQQIPSAARDGALFAQFFEDHDTPTNRTAWAPLNLARYLLERRESATSRWREHCERLIGFVRAHFTHTEVGITVCHEQDEDPQAWGGINATYGAVLALYAQATGSPALAAEARQALNFTLYNIDEGGRPRDLHVSAHAGGWQQDAHTDVIHNYMDALAAFPEWGEAG